MANKLPTTNLGRLAQRLKKGPMTKKQMVMFLLKQSGRSYFPVSRLDSLGNSDYFNSTLYGTRTRQGFLETVAEPTTDGRWTVRPDADLRGPFTPYR